ncbi:MAG: YdcF family protein [Candidatus Rokubacteria bacterium]|nr:YdcF family protein [Candidatus Rokubacteria bacterium]
MAAAGSLILLVHRADALLVMSAPLERADAIVILLGGLPYRAMEAGEVYRAGYAPRIIVSRLSTPDPRSAIFRSFGVDILDDDESATRILARYGVPRSAILISIADRVGTGPELRAVGRVLSLTGLRSVIVVTDPIHIRRAYLYMVTQGVAGLRVIPHTSRSLHGSAAWWRNTRHAEAVVHEYAGLVVFAYQWFTGALKPDASL